MFILTIEYFTGSYDTGVKQYRLTTVYTEEPKYDKVLIKQFGKNNYFILDVEEK
jgi:uncharacterized membrane protein